MTIFQQSKKQWEGKDLNEPIRQTDYIQNSKTKKTKMHVNSKINVITLYIHSAVGDRPMILTHDNFLHSFCSYIMFWNTPYKPNSKGLHTSFLSIIIIFFIYLKYLNKSIKLKCIQCSNFT